MKPAKKTSRRTSHPDLPPYWAQACAQLGQKDRVLRRLIPQLGEHVVRPSRDAFTTLARSIVGQQITVAAAQTLWQRLLALLPEPVAAVSVPANTVAQLALDLAAPATEEAPPRTILPADLLQLRAEEMRVAGLSPRKVDYLLALAQQFATGKLRPQSWAALEDEAIIQQLMQLRGVGRWTAEMFLMFHLLRPNVLPLDDAGLIKGISHNYFSGDPVSRHEAREVAQAWQPWCSVATWYIWRSLQTQPLTP
ncbi:MAG: DNA-3-methyladenine glycosylase 2 family protein [Giesbergeria sp.]|uniref:DNA-3-methyladenine glycosylase family protein n=1 Tax=Giesbergeria sp. TaxID=2818473 RepID=UPI002628439B|nr:DNA-3-methyladenine glycosylase 2 family protein [Giesbergeria sp.]MDD2609631.1 DNA-3-methyladenine glycosylase 2 family protein [Giesbergeria sp.]